MQLTTGKGENNATGEAEEEEGGGGEGKRVRKSERQAQRVYELFKALGFTVVLTTTHSALSLLYCSSFSLHSLAVN